jgi:FAD/FMN-containing dehydrogenase
MQKGKIVIMKFRTVTLEQHDSDVARIARELRDRKSTRPLSLRKKVTSHQVPKPGDKKYSDDKIDVSCLNRILAIDVEGRTCTAEPGVTFIDLVRATLPLGLVPS